MMRSFAAVLGLVFAGSAAAACAASAPDPRYASRREGCAVKSFPGEAELPVDDLGTVTVGCVSGRGTCQRQLLDAVCQRGGDVAWGLADNSLDAATLVAHAAHTRRSLEGPRARGCPVEVFTAAPHKRTENIGPVAASCTENDSKEACLRELEDQVCLLGGDVLWQVEGPSLHGDKQRLSGRAAHSK
ncbi:MAG: hypothetical protein M3O50_08330 [Myxococcota bacterium]|nr:hypothetical protein [Myxococcota bacterium]